MRPLHLTVLPGEPLRLLAVGAHADDLEIGAGGTILRLLDEHPGSSVAWAVLSATAERRQEAERAAECFLERAAARSARFLDLPDGRFPAAFDRLKDALESLKGEAYDLIVAPRTNDAHQDHRTTGEVVWQTFRDHLIVEYEIPKYDGDLGRPNLFVALDEATVERKVGLLMDLFPSQRSRRWYDPEAFRAILRLRGVEAGVRFAEAFDCRKIVL